jgi:hypothetical protein
MDNEIISLTQSLSKNVALAPQDFSTCVEVLGCNFPEDYLEFMALYNGAEGEMQQSWLQLWPIQELSELNEGYEVSSYLPNVLLIGSNGGGEAFGIKKQEGTFVQVPFLFNEEDVSEIGSSFKEFLVALNRPFIDRIGG